MAQPSRPGGRIMTLEEEIEARERALRDLVEERIQAAMQAGAFDDLPGKGKPLQLEENPFVPPELRLAHKLLADANFAPDWIELDKKVRALRDEICALQQRHIAWLRREAQERGTPTERPGKAVRARQQHVRRKLRQRLEEINRHIDELNLIVPHLSLQRPRMAVDEVLSDFDAACRHVYLGLEKV